MPYMHTEEAAVTSTKIDIFMLVTMKSVTHSGWFVCISSYVGEFGMDTGQPMVTSNGLSNHLSEHHKAYYTYIIM